MSEVNFGESALKLLSALLLVMLAGVFILWWWVFARIFAHKKDNDSRAAFMLVMFLCIMVDMGRSVDPFYERDVTSYELLRCGMQVETCLLLVLLLVAADAASWLNYFALEGLLIKPVRTFRHILYIGATASVFLTIIVIVFYASVKTYYQGVVMGSCFSNLLLILWALTSMFISVMEVRGAIKTVQQTDDQLLESGEVEHLPTREEVEYADKTQKKTKRVAKYIGLIAIILILDVCLGVPITGGNADFINFVYGVSFKSMLALMLWQRRPVKGGRQYEHNIHMRYKPFETFVTGDTATRTVKSFKKMCREVTSLKTNDGNAARNSRIEAKFTRTGDSPQGEEIAMSSMAPNMGSLSDNELEPEDPPVTAPMEARRSKDGDHLVVQWK